MLKDLTISLHQLVSKLGWFYKNTWSLKIIKWKISTLFMRHGQIVFSFLLTYFVRKRLWHHHVSELHFKNTDSLISREVKFWTYTRSADSIIRGNYFRGKICINSRPQLWSIALTGSQPCLLDFNHFVLSYSIRRSPETS